MTKSILKVYYTTIGFVTRYNNFTTAMHIEHKTNHTNKRPTTLTYTPCCTYVHIHHRLHANIISDSVLNLRGLYALFLISRRSTTFKVV